MIGVLGHCWHDALKSSIVRITDSNQWQIKIDDFLHVNVIWLVMHEVLNSLGTMMAHFIAVNIYLTTQFRIIGLKFAQKTSMSSMGLMSNDNVADGDSMMQHSVCCNSQNICVRYPSVNAVHGTPVRENTGNMSSASCDHEGMG